mgnify:CR=1 FL=1
MLLDAFRLDGKTAIVTGAGKGIGASIAKSFAEMGASVFCVARSIDDIEQVAEACRGFGVKAEAIVCLGSPSRKPRAQPSERLPSATVCTAVRSVSGVGGRSEALGHSISGSAANSLAVWSHPGHRRSHSPRAA